MTYSRFARLAGMGATMVLLALATASLARAGWGGPFRIAGPESTDISAVQLAVSSSGEVGVTFSLYDEDAPTRSSAFLTIRSADGRADRTRRVPGAQQPLGLVFDGDRVDLLTGTSARGQACCAEAAVQDLSNGGFGPARRLTRQLAGATQGDVELLPGHRLLVALGTDRGVWVAQSRASGRFSRVRRLASSAGVPWAMAGAESAGGRTAVSWVQAADRSGESGPNQLLVAEGSPFSSPRHPRLLASAEDGHAFDELALAPRGSGFGVAWIESWFDGFGAYHAQVVAGDVSRTARPRSLTVAGETASGLTLAGGAGAQVLAFRACDQGGSCSVWASYRPQGAGFSAPVRLGAVDPGQAPAAIVAAGGTAVLGWISGGRVFAATRSARARRFGPDRLLSPARYAADLTLAAGSGGAGPQAVAAWTQGTLSPSVVAAELR